jgi:hypothetical protein
LSETDTGSKRSIKDLFRRKKSTGSSSNLKGSASLSSLAHPEVPAVALAPGKLALKPGAGAVASPVLGGVSKDLMKQPASTIAGHIAAQKAVPEFENFTLTPNPKALGSELGDTRKYQPSEAPVTRPIQNTSAPQPIATSQQKPKLSNPAPEIANQLYDDKRAGFNPETTLTGNITEPVSQLTPAERPRTSNIFAEAPGKSPVVSQPPVHTVTPNTPAMVATPPNKLKGPAPEIASTIQSQNLSPSFDNTTLTSPTAVAPVSNLPSQRMPQTPTGVMTPIMTPKTPTVAATTPAAVHTTPVVAPTTPVAAATPVAVHTTPVVAPTTPVFAPTTPVVVPTTPVVVPTTPVATTPQPQKLKGPAPEIAATVQERQPPKYLDDVALTNPSISPAVPIVDISKQPYQKAYEVPPSPKLIQPQPVRTDAKPIVYEKPYIDTDISPPRRTAPPETTPESVYIQPLPQYRTERPSQRKFSDDELSHGSDVHSDGEFYLDVGKSAYYHERCQSLKRYKSKRSLAQDREARRSLGLMENRDSTRSSISSITAEELREIRSYDYGRKSERPFVSSRATPQKLYTPAPAVEISAGHRLTISNAQLLRDEFTAEMPVPLSTGRCAHIQGHFLEENKTTQSCIIRLGANKPVCENGYDGLLLEYHFNGTLIISVLVGCQKIFFGRMDCGSVGNRINFKIDLHVRASYLALTVCDFISQMMPKPIDPSLLTFMRLEYGTGADIDQFSISSHLELPVELVFPDGPCRKDLQTLNLGTRLYADTPSVTLTFMTQMKKTFSIVFDFVADQLYIMAAASEYSQEGKTTIPFVPEQIRSIRIKRNAGENCLWVFANERELLVHTVPIDRPVGKLSTVKIAGDFALLNARLD